MRRAETVGVNEVDEAQIRALLLRWAAAVERGDMEGVLARHAENIVMFDVPPQLQAIGLEAYRATWEAFFAVQPTGSFALHELQITVGDRVAFGHAIVRCGPVDPAGQFDVRLTVGLRKDDGGWVVTHEHHSALA